MRMMPGSTPTGYTEEEYAIRYDGLDADRHEMDLNQLGISLQGFARVLAVCAHFSSTGKYNKQYDTLSVKVVAVPTERHHCYEITAWVKSVAASADLWSGAGGAVLVAILQYIFSRRKEEEMRYLNDALKLALGQNADTNAKLLATIEKMADALRPAAKQALAPIGSACSSIGVHSAQGASVVLDQATKDRFTSSELNTIQPSKTYVGVISEMDMETGTCRVKLDGDESAARIVAAITDPVGRVAANPYVTAMGEIRPINFVAKAEIDSDGNIVKLYISDIVTPPR